MAIKRNLDTSGYSASAEGLFLILGGYPKFFDYAWLREGCKCPRCVDGSTKQRDFNMAEIPHDIEADTVKWDGDQLEIRWKNDIEGYTDHVTKYSREYLSNPTPGLNGTGRTRFKYFWTKSTMTEMQHWISFEDYMNDEAKFAFAMRQLSLLGLIFVKDIPDSREMVEKIATRMGPLRNSFYGPTWDVRSVPEAKNVAYTHKPLDFHMDLLYMNEPPGYQLLHCLQNSCEGGESLFADTFQVALYMRLKFPGKANRLANTVLNYEYAHDYAHYNNHWPVFNYSGDGTVLHNVNYSPPFQAHTHPSSWKTMKKTTGHPMGPLSQFASLLKSEGNVFETKMQPGQCVIFENRRVVHSRRQFDATGGQRWLAGAYIDEDALRSQFWKCANQQPEAWRMGISHVRSVADSLKAGATLDDTLREQWREGENPA